MDVHTTIDPATLRALRAERARTFDPVSCGIVSTLISSAILYAPFCQPPLTSQFRRVIPPLAGTHPLRLLHGPPHGLPPPHPRRGRRRAHGLPGPHRRPLQWPAKAVCADVRRRVEHLHARVRAGHSPVVLDRCGRARAGERARPPPRTRRLGRHCCVSSAPARKTKVEASARSGDREACAYRGAEDVPARHSGGVARLLAPGCAAPLARRMWSVDGSSATQIRIRSGGVGLRVH